MANESPGLEDAQIRVLLVENDAAHESRIATLLQQAGPERFAVDRFTTVAEGAAQLSAAGHDVCLLDQDLPDGDGLHLARIADHRGIATPIVMLTGGGSLELDAEAMAAGVADFVDKRHLDGAVLGRTIHHALARRRRTERLDRLAQYDELTGLANRSLYRDRLDRALAWARRQGRMAAVMVLDLNGFKAVNDQLGHSAGDRLLKVIAERLTSRLRETDTVARLGGDEFALIIENLAKPEYAALVARKLLDLIAPPVKLDGQEASVTASLGVALYPGDAEDAEELVRRADRAMYRAKAEGGNLCRFDSDQIERQVQRGALLETDLRRGLERGEFVLHYQPQVTLTASALGLSGMLRWRHPELGLIGQERFLPLAEDSGLLPQLTERLFEAGTRQLREWHDQGLERVQLALPLLSRHQLMWTDLASRLERHLYALDLPPGRLEIELSEALLLADIDAGGAGVAALDRLGVRLALDGFGRGLTSLQGLQLRTLDTLKLARELHQDVPGDPQRSAVAGAIITLARELGLRVVAEGVDRREQLAFLRRCGCDAVQAFMSCPPLPAEACTSWLRQANARQDRRPPGVPARLPPPEAHPAMALTAAGA